MNGRALVVDDNEALAEDLAEILSDEGYLVRVFCDPLEVLRASATLDFDVALLDVRMPSIDGVALHERLLAQNPRARFIMMTAYTEDHRIAQALGAGVHRVLTKPFSTAAMLAELAALREARP